MDATVRVLLCDPDPAVRAAFGEAFEDRPEVTIVEGTVFATDARAWVVETKRGDLSHDALAALGPEVEARLRAEIGARFGGALPADFAVTVPRPDGYVIAVSNGARNPHGVDDALRVAIAAGAALQAVHVANARAPGTIDSVALPPLGPAALPAPVRAELMWTAHELFREAVMPDFPTMRRALAGLLVGVDPGLGPGAYKRSFAVPESREVLKSTLPEKGARKRRRPT